MMSMKLKRLKTILLNSYFAVAYSNTLCGFRN